MWPQPIEQLTSCLWCLAWYPEKASVYMTVWSCVDERGRDVRQGGGSKMLSLHPPPSSGSSAWGLSVCRKAPQLGGVCANVTFILCFWWQWSSTSKVQLGYYCMCGFDVLSRWGEAPDFPRGECGSSQCFSGDHHNHITKNMGKQVMYTYLRILLWLPTVRESWVYTSAKDKQWAHCLASNSPITDSLGAKTDNY